MKNLIFTLLAAVVVLSMTSVGDVHAKGGSSKPAAGQEVKPAGDDVFPWPWGSECPFPWREIEGSWVVKGEASSAYNGHYMIFTVQKEDDGVKILEIAQYDRRGYLRASGTGFSEKDKRVVKGIMAMEESGKNYVVMVRSYSKNKKSCRATDLVSAITFCPIRGKKCMEDSNYVLERADVE